MNGSPTWTLGRFCSTFLELLQAMVAPWMPSRPVLRAHVDHRVPDA